MPPDTIRASVNPYDTISLMSFPTIADSANMFILATNEIEDTTASVHYYEWVPDVCGEGAVSNGMLLRV
ncbi:hypothetical protein DPMN_152280 [Dreissena polymorpha]|uniref:Uncharacterized protein n=1 Tax=Dreissena polymorpha TaxID=45954 RepID=A0A9D4J7R9_DREPO|nr:hypothetical protein DPMN_152280 [Dreissena polymorpha]